MRFGQGGSAETSRKERTDQSDAKMSIDTSKNKDLSSAQTIAQWFALEFRQISSRRK
jgi:hypothetical protein